MTEGIKLDEKALEKAARAISKWALPGEASKEARAAITAYLAATAQQSDFELHIAQSIKDIRASGADITEREAGWISGMENAAHIAREYAITAQQSAKADLGDWVMVPRRALDLPLRALEAGSRQVRLGREDNHSSGTIACNVFDAMLAAALSQAKGGHNG